ncbi:hypothetical protein IKS57_03710, partial [bacterium]|nr:hypothetical protein [bacterium]
SSMDFNYIYFIPSIIQQYASYNDNNEKNYRNNVIVLTHSFEFFNVLMINYNYKGFSLYNGKINELEFSILPYFNHLLDVYNVYVSKNEGINHSHTILTSIRYIIETMQNFQYPDKRKNSENPFIKLI